jgi:predicted transcriptional regulator
VTTSRAGSALEEALRRRRVAAASPAVRELEAAIEEQVAAIKEWRVIAARRMAARASGR